MNKVKEKQIRKCIVTNQHFNKAEMIRIVSFRGEPIKFDLSGKANGRGCYVSLDYSNLEKLLSKNGAILARTFKRAISKDELIYLENEFPKMLSEKQFRPKQSKKVVVRLSKKDYINKLNNS